MRKNQNVLFGAIITNTALGECGIKLEWSERSIEVMERLTVAGIIKEAVATTINEDIVDATVVLKPCSIPSAVPVLVL